MPQETADYDPRYLAGILLFNEAEYFEAHEVWEELWTRASGNDRKFCQGLIQAAVGLCHFGNGNLRGAIKLYHSAHDYMKELPSPFLGLDLHVFWTDMERCFGDLLRASDGGAGVMLDDSRLPAIRLDPEPQAWPNPEEFVEEDADS